MAELIGRLTFHAVIGVGVFLLTRRRREPSDKLPPILYGAVAALISFGLVAVGNYGGTHVKESHRSTGTTTTSTADASVHVPADDVLFAAAPGITFDRSQSEVMVATMQRSLDAQSAKSVSNIERMEAARFGLSENRGTISLFVWRPTFGSANLNGFIRGFEQGGDGEPEHLEISGRPVSLVRKESLTIIAARVDRITIVVTSAVRADAQAAMTLIIERLVATS